MNSGETAYDLTGKRVRVAGHRGMVGSARVRRLASESTAEGITVSSHMVDLRRQEPTEVFVEQTRPDVVLLAAVPVGGIEANRTRQAEFLYDDLMPTNLHGPNDNFDPTSSHVFAALLRKVHEAKVSGAPSVTVWGSGSPRREFLHVDDLTDAMIHAVRHHVGADHLNVGWGTDLSIRELAELICDVVGYDGSLESDTSMPDGMPRKLLDVTRMTELGRKPQIGLRRGIAHAHRWYLENIEDGGRRM